MKNHRAGQIAVTLLLAAVCLALWRYGVAASQLGEPPIPPDPSDDPEPFPAYEQQPVTRSSNLPLQGADRVSDRELARYITTYLGITNCHSMKFVFGQCFGGGMIDELAEAGITCTVSAQSAARHDEPSWGNRSEDYYLEALAEILEMSPTLSLEEAAELARERDPRGPYASDPANRKEHPQYHGSGPLSSTVTMTGADSFHAILLAGNPDGARHWGDLKHWYHLLTSTYGFTAGQINVLYGDGDWPTGNDGDGSPFPDDPGIEMISATLENLTRTLEEIGELMNPNEQFFFLSSDHGGRGAVPTTPDGDVGDGSCSWTDADGSCRIDMAVSLSQPELNQVTEGSALAFAHESFSEMGTTQITVWFNDSFSETYASGPGSQEVVIYLNPDQFSSDNTLVFSFGPTAASRIGPASTASGFGRVEDVRLWFGPLTTQLSSPYGVYLPLVLLRYP